MEDQDRGTLERTEDRAVGGLQQEELIDRLADLAQAVGTAPDLLSVYRALSSFARASVPCNGVFVSLYDPELEMRVPVYAWSEGEELDVSSLPPMPMTDSPNSRAVATGRTIVTDDFQAVLQSVPHVDVGMDRDHRLPQSSLAVPLMVLGRPIGAFEVQSVIPAAYRADHVTSMRMAANLAAIATQNVQLLDRERQLRWTAQVSEERYRSVSELVSDFAYAYRLEPDGTLVWEWATEACIRITGQSPQQIVAGTGWMELVVADDRDIALQHRAAVHAGKQQISEYRILTPAGQLRWLRDFSRPVLSDNGSRAIRVYGATQDITERRLLEEQLRQAQKMEAVGRLAGGVAHDFNNMLAVVHGYSEMLLAADVDDDSVRSALKEIRDAGQRAALLTQQLLAFSRQQVLAPKVLDLNDVVISTDRMLRRLIGEDIELVTVADPSVGLVRVDPGQLGQVLVNLAVNARDAMPLGGKLRIETRDFDLAPDDPRRSLGFEAGRYVLLAVSDSGCGMDRETMAHIFEPFFTTKPHGTGLGLATVYGIVRQSGGHILVDSDPGRGTRFEIYLPRVTDATRDVSVEPAPVGADGGSETILLVEDEPLVRTLVQTILTKGGYTVLTAEEPFEALRLFEQHPGSIELLLTDVIMPGMSGRDLAARIADLRPDIRILFMSGYTDDAVLRHGVSAAQAAFIQKPFRPEALLRKVRQTLAAGEASARQRRVPG